MKKKKTDRSALEASFGYLSSKARTVRETERYLGSLEYGEREISEAIGRLRELSYLDDGKYASDFVESRLAAKPVSRRALREQLMSHLLDREDIDAALERVTDEAERDNARAAAEKYFRQAEGMDAERRKQRVMRRLMSRGYGFELIRDMAEEIGERAGAAEKTEEDGE